MGLLQQKRRGRGAMTELLKIGYQVRLCIVLASEYIMEIRTIARGSFCWERKKGHKLTDFPKATHRESPGLLRRELYGRGRLG
jgi:hypothetical protein